jgi:hypothetical protein
LDAAVGSTNDIDASDWDVGVDSFTGLDGEGGDEKPAHAIDMHISLIFECGSDTEGTIVNREYEVALTKVVT